MAQGKKPMPRSCIRDLHLTCAVTEEAAREIVSLISQVASAFPTSATSAPASAECIKALPYIGIQHPVLIFEVVSALMTHVATTTFPDKTLRHCRGAFSSLFDAEASRTSEAFHRHSTLHPMDSSRPADVTAQVLVWKERADSTFNRFPLSPEAWRRVLSRLPEQPAPTGGWPDLKPSASHLEWIDPVTVPAPVPERMVVFSHNLNGLPSRLRSGDFCRLLRDQAPRCDVMIFPEIKTNVSSIPQPHLLRAALHELGFAYVSLSWNSSNPFTHGIMVAPRRVPQSTAFGVGDGTDDPEGRTSILRYPSISVISSYTPSTCAGDRHDSRRIQYNREFLSLAQRERERGVPLLVGGDLNICPHEDDSSLPLVMQHSFPSSKPFERQDFARLLHGANLHEPYLTLRDSIPTDSRYTWSSPRGSISHVRMRLDHWLLSTLDPPLNVNRYDHVPWYGSDHRGGLLDLQLPRRPVY